MIFESFPDYDALSAHAAQLFLTAIQETPHVVGSTRVSAFDAPGIPGSSRTRVVELAASTGAANAALCPGEAVPARAITMGVATILASRRIILLASGERKRAAIARLRSGER